MSPKHNFVGGKGGKGGALAGFGGFGINQATQSSLFDYSLHAA